MLVVAIVAAAFFLSVMAVVKSIQPLIVCAFLSSVLSPFLLVSLRSDCIHCIHRARKNEITDVSFR